MHYFSYSQKNQENKEVIICFLALFSTSLLTLVISFLFFLIIPILRDLRYYLIVVLTCISVIISDEYLYTCPSAICRSSLEKCFFKWSAHFLLSWFAFCCCWFALFTMPYSFQCTGLLLPWLNLLLVILSFLLQLQIRLFS